MLWPRSLFNVTMHFETLQVEQYLSLEAPAASPKKKAKRQRYKARRRIRMRQEQAQVQQPGQAGRVQSAQASSAYNLHTKSWNFFDETAKQDLWGI